MDVFNLAYTLKNEKTYFLSLHLQGENETREIVIKFLWKKELRPNSFFDIETQKGIDITKLDHITYHKDGQILLSYYSPRKQHFFEKKLPIPLWNIPENSYVPLCIFSINDTKKYMKYAGSSALPGIGEKEVDLTWDNNGEPFSIGIFVVRSNFETSIFEDKFPEVFDTQNAAVAPFAINENIGLAIAISKQLVVPRDNSYVDPKYLNKKFTFDEIPIIGITLAPSDKRINDMKSS